MVDDERRAAGRMLELSGTAATADDRPLVGAVIEIWQTDAGGVYLHPEDPGTASRDQNFQFYGEATTDEAGRYSFRTILPGEYEPRPRHIHVKIKHDGELLLTTQFYFAGTGSGNIPAPLLIDLTEVDEAGTTIGTGERDVVLPLALPAAR